MGKVNLKLLGADSFLSTLGSEGIVYIICELF